MESRELKFSFEQLYFNQFGEVVDPILKNDIKILRKNVSRLDYLIIVVCMVLILIIQNLQFFSKYGIYISSLVFFICISFGMYNHLTRYNVEEEKIYRIAWQRYLKDNHNINSENMNTEDLIAEIKKIVK